jgi:hypothetical protein
MQDSVTRVNRFTREEYPARSKESGWLCLLVIPYWKAIKSVRLSVTDFGFNGSFVRLALPEFKTL